MDLDEMDNHTPKKRKLNEPDDDSFQKGPRKYASKGPRRITLCAMPGCESKRGHPECIHQPSCCAPCCKRLGIPCSLKSHQASSADRGKGPARARLTNGQGIRLHVQSEASVHSSQPGASPTTAPMAAQMASAGASPAQGGRATGSDVSSDGRREENNSGGDNNADMANLEEYIRSPRASGSSGHAFPRPDFGAMRPGVCCSRNCTASGGACTSARQLVSPGGSYTPIPSPARAPSTPQSTAQREYARNGPRRITVCAQQGCESKRGHPECVHQPSCCAPCCKRLGMPCPLKSHNRSGARRRKRRRTDSEELDGFSSSGSEEGGADKCRHESCSVMCPRDASPPSPPLTGMLAGLTAHEADLTAHMFTCPKECSVCMALQGASAAAKRATQAKDALLLSPLNTTRYSQSCLNTPKSAMSPTSPLPARVDVQGGAILSALASPRRTPDRTRTPQRTPTRPVQRNLMRPASAPNLEGGDALFALAMAASNSTPLSPSRLQPARPASAVATQVNGTPGHTPPHGTAMSAPGASAPTTPSGPPPMARAGTPSSRLQQRTPDRKPMVLTVNASAAAINSPQGTPANETGGAHPMPVRLDVRRPLSLPSPARGPATPSVLFKVDPMDVELPPANANPRYSPPTATATTVTPSPPPILSPRAQHVNSSAVACTDQAADQPLVVCEVAPSDENPPSGAVLAQHAAGTPVAAVLEPPLAHKAGLGHGGEAVAGAFAPPRHLCPMEQTA